MKEHQGRRFSSLARGAGTEKDPRRAIAVAEMRVPAPKQTIVEMAI